MLLVAILVLLVGLWTLLLLSLIDVISSLWPWMTLDDGRDGKQMGMSQM